MLDLEVFGDAGAVPEVLFPVAGEDIDTSELEVCVRVNVSVIMTPDRVKTEVTTERLAGLVPLPVVALVIVADGPVLFAALSVPVAMVALVVDPGVTALLLELPVGREEIEPFVTDGPIVVLPGIIVKVTVPTMTEVCPGGPAEVVLLEIGNGAWEPPVLLAGPAPEDRPDESDVPPVADGITELDGTFGAGTPEINSVLVQFPDVVTIVVGRPASESLDVSGDGLIFVTLVTQTDVHADPPAPPVPISVLVKLTPFPNDDGNASVMIGFEAVTVMFGPVLLLVSVDVQMLPPDPDPMMV